MAEEQSQAESMPDAAEAEAIRAELYGQEVSPEPAVSPPVETPVETPAPAEATEVSQAPDYAALEAKVAKLGDGYKLQDSPEIIKNLLSGMNEAQRQANETKQRYQPYDGLIEGLKDPDLSRRLEETAKEYYDQADGVQQPPEVTQALDPVMNRLNQMEAKLANQEMQEQVAKLRSDGYDVSPETETKIWNKVIETGNRNVKDHFWAINGEGMVASAKEAGKQETVEGIRKANDSYTPVPGGTAPETPGFDAATASPAEIDAEWAKDLAGM